MSGDLVRNLALALPALLLSLSVHEYAHAWAATRLGDPTPRMQGRLTLNPMSHLDWFGTVLFPVMMLALSSGSAFFGWAKPVQFNPANFSKKVTMRGGAALTAVAGPLSNVLLAMLALFAVRVVYQFGLLSALPVKQQEMILQFLQMLVFLNVLLAAFNLIPLPPLDGSYLLPRSMDNVKAFLARHSMWIFVLVFLLPFPFLNAPLSSIVLGPVMRALDGLVRAVAFAGA